MDEMLRQNWYWLVVLGTGAGILSATLGIGSGIVVVPALSLLLGFAQKSAQGIALALMVPMALMGALRYYWHPQIKMPLGALAILIPCAIIGANIGSSVAAALPDAVLKRLFGAFIALVGVHMLWKG
jgi:uncharacterized membrane protein YfcA